MTYIGHSVSLFSDINYTGIMVNIGVTALIYMVVLLAVDMTVSIVRDWKKSYDK